MRTRFCAGMEPTAYSVRFAPASGSGSCPTFGDEIRRGYHIRGVTRCIQPAERTSCGIYYSRRLSWSFSDHLIRAFAVPPPIRASGLRGHNVDATGRLSVDTGHFNTAKKTA
jgi:hypothetical protein